MKRSSKNIVMLKMKFMCGCNPFSQSSNWHIENSAYASFPGNLTFKQFENCVDDSGLLSDIVFNDGKINDTDVCAPLPAGINPVRVSWLDRCMLQPGDLLDRILVLMIAWLQ